MHKKKKYPSNVLSQVTISGHRYFPIRMDQHIDTTIVFLIVRMLFHKRLDKDAWKYTQNPSFEKIKKVFSKRSQNVLLLHLKIYHHYRNIFATVAIFDISTKPNRSRSFSYSSRFSLFSSDSTGGRNIYDRNTEVKDRTRSKISHASVIDDDSKQKMGQIRRDVAWFLSRKKVRNNI